MHVVLLVVVALASSCLVKVSDAYTYDKSFGEMNCTMDSELYQYTLDKVRNAEIVMEPFHMYSSKTFSGQTSTRASLPNCQTEQQIAKFLTTRETTPRGTL